VGCPVSVAQRAATGLRTAPHPDRQAGPFPGAGDGPPARAPPDNIRSGGCGRPATSAASSSRHIGVPGKTVGTVAARAPLSPGVTPRYS